MMAVMSCLFISFHTAVVLPKEENKRGNLLLKSGSRVGKSVPRNICFGLAWCFGYSLGRYPDYFYVGSTGVSRVIENCFVGRSCSEINTSTSVPSFT